MAGNLLKSVFGPSADPGSLLGGEIDYNLWRTAVEAQALADSRAAKGQISQGTVSSAGSGPPPTQTRQLREFSSGELQEQIMRRLRLREYDKMPFDSMHCYVQGEDKVLVFVANQGQYCTIEDGAEFPSDGLMAQLRLLIKHT
jgi:hypothetical protein